MKKVTKPQTAVPIRIALAGVCGAAIATVLIWTLGELLGLLEPILFLVLCAAPMWALELRRFPARPSRIAAQSMPVWRRKLRLIGLASLIGMFCFTVAIFRAASPAPLAGFEALLLLLLCVAAVWMGWMALRRPPGRSLDSVELLGKATIRVVRFRTKTKRTELQTILGWLVKAFYLPLMISSTYVFLAWARESTGNLSGWMAVFSGLYMLIFAIDTAFATIGYCSTSKRIDAHIRSTEATLLGWASAIVCYPPLNSLVLQQWLSYNDAIDWRAWLAGSPLLSFAWGIAILLSVTLYVSATVSFGLRFSNLTNRGIITSGPYHYFKHPSYIGKNIAWWLISVPFISNAGALAALGNCAALLAINGIYCIRAKTEERHLMKDPVYQAYSAWIAEHGLIERIFRRFSRKILGC
ncbi:isoprenylcysteine carboxylmethyltransferase family protein [Variovorax paradoxus]|uniref:isoprenylcysteine carboxylmethyltransferase family protein n=1 Tax=Variovorax paradoxus TaxID=34073 RepID=UPI003D662874